MRGIYLPRVRAAKLRRDLRNGTMEESAEKAQAKLAKMEAAIASIESAVYPELGDA